MRHVGSHVRRLGIDIGPESDICRLRGWGVALLFPPTHGCMGPMGGDGDHYMVNIISVTVT